MVISIFCNSIHITNRLVELIDETNHELSFFSAFSYKEAMDCLLKHQMDVVLLDVDFAGNKAFELLEKMQLFSDKTVVIGLYSVASEFSIKQFRDGGAGYLFDIYNDFEKIAPVIKTIRKGLMMKRATN